MNRREFLSVTAAFPLIRLNRSILGSNTPPNRKRLGASTACLAGLSLPDAIQEIKRLGFSTIEMIAYTGARHSVGEIPGFDFDKTSEKERESVFKATRSFRHISAHMPFQNINLLSKNEEVRKSALDTVKKAMDGLAYLKGELAVVHVGWPDKGLTYKDIWQQMVDTLRSLGDYAGRRGLKIGIETMQPGSVREYTGLIADVNHPMVGATIDTGHIRGAADIGLPPEGRDSVEGRQNFNNVLNKIAEALGEKALHLHLTDVKVSDWRDHHTVGTGIIDFPRFFNTLKKIRFKGLMVFELEEPNKLDALKASKSFIEKLI